jgi:protein EFR3
VFPFQDSVLLSLSSREIALLLSSLWAQSIRRDNCPENYEAIAHTYSLMLLFSRVKVNQDIFIYTDTINFGLSLLKVNLH